MGLRSRRGLQDHSILGVAGGPEDRKDEYEREAEYDFIENIDLGSLDKIVISDTKNKKST